MAGCMNDFKTPVAEIDNIAVFEKTLRRRRLDPVALRLPSSGEAIEHLFRRIFAGQREVIARIGKDCSFGRMHAAMSEFVMAAYMIEMRVAGDAEQRPFRHQLDMLTQAEMAEA